MRDPENITQERRSEYTHVPEQYEAGYGARFQEEPFSLAATPSWQAGWNDANHELGKFDDAFTAAQSALPFFGTGDEARRRGLPFDPGCPEEWKRGWIAADVSMGLNEADLYNAPLVRERNTKPQPYAGDQS